MGLLGVGYGGPAVRLLRGRGSFMRDLFSSAGPIDMVRPVAME